MNTKIVNRDKKYPRGTSHKLDTLETTAEIFYSESHEKQYSKGIRKYKTNQKVIALTKQTDDPKWQKRFWDTWHCNDILLQEGKVLKGSRCRRRWCSNCERTKAIKRVRELLPTLTKMNDWHFVTLTAPTIKYRQMTAEIKKRKKYFKLIVDRLRKQGIKVNALRSLETEYNEDTDKYHPHFHILVVGERVANLLQKYWLEYNKDASIKAQDIKKVIFGISEECDVKNLLELFKYIVKGSDSKDKELTEKRAKAMVNIYTSLHEKRVFQVYGNIPRIKEDIEKVESTEIDFLPFQNEIWQWVQSQRTYLDSNDKRMIEVKHIASLLEDSNLNKKLSKWQQQ